MEPKTYCHPDAVAQTTSTFSTNLTCVGDLVGKYSFKSTNYAFDMCFKVILNNFILKMNV